MRVVDQLFSVVSEVIGIDNRKIANLIVIIPQLQPSRPSSQAGGTSSLEGVNKVSELETTLYECLGEVATRHEISVTSSLSELFLLDLVNIAKQTVIPHITSIHITLQRSTCSYAVLKLGGSVDYLSIPLLPLRVQQARESGLRVYDLAGRSWGVMEIRDWAGMRDRMIKGYCGGRLVCLHHLHTVRGTCLVDFECRVDLFDRLVGVTPAGGSAGRDDKVYIFPKCVAFSLVSL
jgi:hypothetical protein